MATELSASKATASLVVASPAALLTAVDTIAVFVAIFYGFLFFTANAAQAKEGGGGGG
jgi:hypothetical protein